MVITGISLTAGLLSISQAVGLLALSSTNPFKEPVGLTLSSVLGVILVIGVIMYYNKR
jgi:uncharacterized membrane protein